MVFGRLSTAVRKFSTTAVRRYGDGGHPGENLPFDIENLPKFTIYFALFLSSGIATPFLIVRHQLLKH